MKNKIAIAADFSCVIKATVHESRSNFFRPHALQPRLLVSVRSADEAISALAGGAEILDIKEPSLGSLGMAGIGEIVSITTLSEITETAIPLSVALGEVVDWTRPTKFPSLPGGITFAKLGLSACANNTKWREDWQRIRIEFERRSESAIQWVAVAYADFTEAQSPGIADVLAAAIDSGCSGLLIDTWTKDGRSLLDRIGESEMVSIANECYSGGMFFAMAGQLSFGSLAKLTRVPADVLAIRSAACHQIDRTGEVDQHRVSEFRNEIRRVFAQA